MLDAKLEDPKKRTGFEKAFCRSVMAQKPTLLRLFKKVTELWSSRFEYTSCLFSQHLGASNRVFRLMQ